jgi:Flp pilus assembly protein TadD
MQKAVHLPGTDAYSVYAYGTTLLKSGRNAKAIEVFSLNQKQHPDEKFWTYLGLARGYTAVGDKKNAIASWEVVVRNVPANLSNRTPAFEQTLKKLKEST